MWRFNGWRSTGVKSALAIAVVAASCLTACDQVKRAADDAPKSATASKACTRTEIAARVAELGAEQAERQGLDERDLPLSWVRDPDARQLEIRENARRRFMQRQLDETNRFVAATGRVQAAVLRNDLKKACTLLDELEAPSKPKVNYPRPVIHDYVIGPPKSPLRVVEFISYGCKECMAFHYDLMQQLIIRQMFRGQVRLVMREFIKDPAEIYAVVLARCAGADRFMPISGSLARSPETWVPQTGETGNTALEKTKERLRAIGEEWGVEAAQYDGCLANAELKEKIAARHLEATTDLGVEGPYAIQIGTGGLYQGAMQWNAVLAEIAHQIDQRSPP